MTDRLEKLIQYYDLLIPLDNTNIDILCELFKISHYSKEEELYLIIFLEPNYGVKAIVGSYYTLLDDFFSAPEYYNEFKKLIVSAEHIEKATALMSIDISHSKIIDDMLIPSIKDSLVQSYSKWFYLA